MKRAFSQPDIRSSFSQRHKSLVIAFLAWMLPALLLAGQQGPNPPETELTAAFAQADQARGAGNYARAEEIYLGVLRTHQHLLAAETNLGLVYYLDRRYEESSKYLLVALRQKPDLFPALLVAGIDLLRLYQPQRAIPLLRQARAQQPSDEYVNINLSTAEFRAGDYVQACADYLVYLQQPAHKKDVRAWYGLGEATLALSQEIAARFGKQPPSNPYRLRLLAEVYSSQQLWSLAIDRLQALRVNPGWETWTSITLGDIYIRQGTYVKAEAEFRRATNAQPDSAAAHFGLGVSLLLEGRISLAQPELVAASQVPWLFAHPNELAADAHDTPAVKMIQPVTGMRSGSVLVDSFVEAVAHGLSTGQVEQEAEFQQTFHTACDRAHRANEARIKEVTTSHPVSERLSALATDFLTEGDVEAAQDALPFLAPQISADSAVPLRISVLAAQGKALDALVVLLPALQAPRGKVSPEAEFQIVQILHQITDLALHQVVESEPGSVYAHLLEAQVADSRNQRGPAVQHFQLAVEASPDDPLTHFKLGEELWLSGDFLHAIAALKDGLNLDPHNAAANYQVGDSYLSLGNAAQALPFLLLAIKQDPDLKAAYKDLGSIYVTRQEYGEAVRLLERVAKNDTDGSLSYLLYRAYSHLGSTAKADASLDRFKTLKAAAANEALYKAQLASRQLHQNPSDPISTPLGSTPNEAH